MMMLHVVAGDAYASTVSGYVITGLNAAALLLIAWVSRTLIKVLLMQQKLADAIFPDNKKSLPDQVEDIRDDVKDIRLRGSDRLAEILSTVRNTNTAIGGPDQGTQ